MRRILITLTCLFAFAFISKASDDKPITFEQLPQSAQQFVKKYFADRVISVVKLDAEIMGKSYEVIFNNGDNLEFDKNGTWTSLECKQSTVPDAVVPAQILDYVKKNYQGVVIRQISKEDRGAYEVELSNGLELKFNKSFQLVEIDS